MRRSTFIRKILAAGALMSCGSAAVSGAVVYDGFDGYSTGLLSGQTATNTTGLTGAWQFVANNVVSINQTGLTFSDLVVNGGRAQTTSTSNSAMGVDIADGVSVTGTLYHSHLARFDGSGNGAFYTRVNPTTNGGQLTAHFNVAADAPSGSPSDRTGIGYEAGNPGVTNGGQKLSADVTYLVLARFTNVGTALSAGTPGSGRMWVLTEQQFDTFKVGGIDESELNAAAIGGGAADVTSRVADADVTSGTFVFNDTLAMQFALTLPTGLSAGDAYAIDEIRWGTSFDDVLPVPEPGAIGLVALMAAGLIGRRRIRR